MLGMNKEIWFERIDRHGPRVMSGALILALGLQVTATALTWRAGANSPAAVNSKERAGVNGGERANAGSDRRTASVDPNSIVSAHLFGVAAADPGPDSPTAPADVNLVLAGTLATGDPTHGLAIIVQAGDAKVFSAGDPVGDASLLSVYPDRVILDRHGSRETLQLPNSSALAHLSVAGLPTPAGAAGVEEPKKLTQVVRVGGVQQDRNGQIQGFHIFPGKNRAAFGATGLLGGDYVVAVNGTPVKGTDPAAPGSALQMMKTASQATITVERDGQTSDITVDATSLD